MHSPSKKVDLAQYVHFNEDQRIIKSSERKSDKAIVTVYINMIPRPYSLCKTEQVIDLTALNMLLLLFE